MSENHVNQWIFILIITLFIAVLGVIWAKLEKIDDAVNKMQIDIAIIKREVGIKGASSSLLDRMFNK